eukprot:6195071-Pleurochrysis_carterae.AAC.1
MLLLMNKTCISGVLLSRARNAMPRAIAVTFANVVNMFLTLFYDPVLKGIWETTQTTHELIRNSYRCNFQGDNRNRSNPRKRLGVSTLRSSRALAKGCQDHGQRRPWASAVPVRTARAHLYTEFCIFGGEGDANATL